MKKQMGVIAMLAAGALVACSDGPTDVSDTAPVRGEVVITPGVAAPEWVPVGRRADSDLGAGASLGGASSTPITLTPATCSSTASQQVTITYTITGRQASAASFKVNTNWSYNAGSWAGSVPVTVNVPARAAGDPATIRPVNVALANASATASGTSTVTLVPFDVVTSSPAALTVTNGSVTLHVAFEACAVTNTPPTLILPSDIPLEATSSAGAVATFLVTASDAQDGDLTASVSCAPASGTTFPLGTTTVNCSVTDNGGLTTTGSFTITVEDLTPAYFTNFPGSTVNLIAANASGAVLNVASLGITAADVGGVSEPSTVACDYVAGTVLAIGSTTAVSCTASDALGNTSAPSSFNVFVGLNVSGTGFLSPLRMSAPFSAHKRGSTIPHKFLPPTYADGTPATDLADGLRLAILPLGGSLPGEEIVVNDYAAGSTTWRYDPIDGHYIFNLKSTTAWAIGAWTTTVSYAGITLAQTQFELRR